MNDDMNHDADDDADDDVFERRLAWRDPSSVQAALFADAPDLVWLDSGIRAVDGISVLGRLTDIRSTGDPKAGFAVLDAALADLPRIEPRASVVPLGWVGWIAYEVGASAAGSPIHESDIPSIVLGFVDRAVVFDHAAHEVRLLALSAAVDSAAWVRDTGAALAAMTDVAEPEPRPVLPGDAAVRWRHTKAEYLDRIRDCQRHIADGDVYQVCLCAAGVVDGSFEPGDVYDRLRTQSPTHHGGLFRTETYSLLCGSPEQFLSVSSSGRIVTRPMKGTRPRGGDQQLDEALVAELVASEKERAENVMIVDLMRNDISRVAQQGTVEVTELFGVETYATVHQLVSTVEADLPAGVSGADLLRATLPPGSMTGAPKLSAMTIIDRLEAGSRGAFSGVFGRFSVDGSIDLAVVIRSILLTADSARIGAGGGITALSVAEDEYAEVMLKAQTMLAALGVVGE